MMKQSTSFAQLATNLLNVLQGYSKTIRLLLVMFVALTVSAEVWAETITDEITASDLTATSTTYTDFSNVSKSSDAIYAGQSAKNASGNIQLRSKNSNSGIVSTTSGGKVKSVKINVGSGTNTVDVYGSNTVYTAASDLYGNNKGTKIGSLTATGTITFNDDYAYVGIRSNNGAIYLSSIEIVWEVGSSCTEPTITTQPTGATYAKDATATALKVVATGDDLTYQWYSNTSNSTSGATTINNATNSTYTPATSTVGKKYYYCIVSSGSCSTTSNIVSVVISPTYTVTYYANGATSGTVPTDATKYNGGATVTVKGNSGNLAKTGYTFAGWNTKEDGTGTTYAAGTGTFTISSNTTLYAKWTAKQTNISINPNTSNHGTGNNVSVTATYGQALPSFTACTPATGYELVGYYTSVTGGTKVIAKDGKLEANVSGYTDANAKWINESASLTLYAQYSAINYSVQYNGNNGTTACAGRTYTYNTSFTICLDKPTRTGYSFTGWSDGTNTYQPGANYTMPAQNVTFTAQWQILSYTVTWVVNGRESEETVNHGAKVEDAPDIDPNNLPCGQKFAGWTDEPITGTTDDAPNSLYKTAAEIPAIEKNQTFYAVFADYAN